MKATYFEIGDVMRIRICEQVVAREVSQSQDVHVSYAEDGTLVEVVLVNAAAHGWWPPRVKLPAALPGRATHARGYLGLLRNVLPKRSRR